LVTNAKTKEQISTQLKKPNQVKKPNQLQHMIRDVGSNYVGQEAVREQKQSRCRCRCLLFCHIAVVVTSQLIAPSVQTAEPYDTSSRRASIFDQWPLLIV